MRSRSCSSNSSRANSALWAPSIARINSSNFTWIASASRFWVFWIRKTIRKVTIVVPVLMTSCQVSLNPKSGPVRAHARITATARPNASGLPVARAVPLAKRVNQEVGFSGLLGVLTASDRAAQGAAYAWDVPSVARAAGATPVLPVSCPWRESDADMIALVAPRHNLRWGQGGHRPPAILLTLDRSPSQQGSSSGMPPASVESYLGKDTRHTHALENSERGDSG